MSTYAGDDSVPGAVALVGRGDSVEVQAVGGLDAEGGAPMTRDAIFRIASITKPIVAAAVMMLVEDGRLALEEAVGTWLPEIAEPVVVRTPSSPVDDVVAAARPITVLDLLTFRSGWGFPSDFSLPAVEALFTVQSLPDFLAERVFEPLGMVDTGFEVPAANRERFTSY